MNETLVTIIGTVITDVTLKKTQDGTRIASFRVASNQRKFDRESQSWVDGDSLFVSVTCWRDLAKHVASSLVKGDPVIVMGRLYTRQYEMEGQKRSITELDARTVGPDLVRCTVETVVRRRRDGGDTGNGGNGTSNGVGDRADGATGARKPDLTADGPDTGTNSGSGENGSAGDGDADQASRASESRPLQVVGAGGR